MTEPFPEIDSPFAGAVALVRYSCAGITYDNRNGLGSVPDVANLAYRGMLVFMTPETFLALTPPLPDGTDNFETGTSIGTPFLDIDISEDGEPCVRSHEGRHRMRWAGQTVGFSHPLPVAIFMNDGGYPLRARELTHDLISTLRQGCFREKSRHERVYGPLFGDASYLDLVATSERKAQNAFSL